jgi:hypothetical protein
MLQEVSCECEHGHNPATPLLQFRVLRGTAADIRRYIIGPTAPDSVPFRYKVAAGRKRGSSAPTKPVHLLGLWRAVYPQLLLYSPQYAPHSVAPSAARLGLPMISDTAGPRRVNQAYRVLDWISMPNRSCGHANAARCTALPSSNSCMELWQEFSTALDVVGAPSSKTAESRRPGIKRVDKAQLGSRYWSRPLQPVAGDSRLAATFAQAPNKGAHPHPHLCSAP